MWAKIFRNLIISTSILALSGCVSLKLPNQGPQKFHQESAKTRTNELRKINKWNINGAFSIQHDKKVEIANYSWQQSRGNYSLQINSSLNIYSLLIKGRAGHVTLKESKQKPLRAASAESLLNKRLGWSIPISNLKYWVRGLSANGASKSKYDKYGHLVKLWQQGWAVTFSNYINIGRFDLPRTLNIQGHNLKIKIVIKNWAL